MSSPHTDELTRPRAAGGRAPDVFRRGGWVPMRCYDDDELVDFAIVGTGAGGGTLAAKLAEAGFSVVALDAGPYWRPLEDFASDERAQTKLYWTEERISGGDDPIELGSNNSGRGVGGSTVHFTMVMLRFRPAWFLSRTKLGYGHDWPVDWREMWHYYDEVESALAIAGPVNYPANLWICDGSLMPTGGGVNPSLTIMANAARIADRMCALRSRGEL
jgi:choline dehydrogenase-like flavoprotein